MHPINIKLIKGMMKKNLLYLFTVLCTLSFFTACSDDDEKIDDGWKAISATYEAETLILNGTEGTDKSIESVKVEATSADAATIVLGNIVIGESELKLDAKLAKDGKGESYTLTGENKTDDRIVTIQGSVKDGKLTLNTTLKITSPVVATWNLKYFKDPSINDMNVDLVLNTEGLSAANAAYLPFIKPIVGQMISQKVESVTAIFIEDGKLDISFKTIDGSKDQAIIGIIKGLDLRYYVKTTDGKSQLYLAIKKELIGLIAGFVDAEMLETIKGLLVESGNYYSLPLNMNIEDDYAQFYVSKDLLSVVLPIVLPLAPDFAGFAPMIQGMLTEATVFDFGLGFTK